MTRSLFAAGLALASALALTAAAQSGLKTRYTIDTARSHATIEVGKSGALSFAAGHTHEVDVEAIAGTIHVDAGSLERSIVRLTIDAARLKVGGAHEPAGDVPKVQETMDGTQVLDVARYPTIVFESTRIDVKRRSPQSLDVVVSGRLTLRGRTRPVSAPVAVRVDGGTLTATGRFPVKQSDFGIKPVTVGGVVSVKDTVGIAFTIAAR